MIPTARSVTTQGTSKDALVIKEKLGGIVAFVRQGGVGKVKPNVRTLLDFLLCLTR